MAELKFKSLNASIIYPEDDRKYSVIIKMIIKNLRNKN